jgi:hypothetical protein
VSIRSTLVPIANLILPFFVVSRAMLQRPQAKSLLHSAGTGVEIPTLRIPVVDTGGIALELLTMLTFA